MVDSGKAVAYMHNNVQFVRLVQHKWTDSKKLAMVQELGGISTGQDALARGSLDTLMDAFSYQFRRRRIWIWIWWLRSSGPRGRTLTSCTFSGAGVNA